MKQVMKMVIFLLFTCSAKAASFYWVGGNGNWTDFQNHWAMASGGTVFHTSVPTASDDVYFDSNSFPTANDTLVKINTSVAYARQLTFTTAQHLVYLSFNTNAALQVYGSATFADEVKVLKGNFYFKSTSADNQLTFNKTHDWVSTNFTFDGIGGNWTVMDSLTAPGTVYLRNGSLDLSGKVLRCDFFQSNYTSNRTFKFDNAKLFIYKITLNSSNLITTHQHSCIHTTEIQNYSNSNFTVDTILTENGGVLQHVSANVFYGSNGVHLFSNSIVNTCYVDGGSVSANGLVISDGNWAGLFSLSIGSLEILGELTITGNDCTHRLNVNNGATAPGTLKKSSGSFTFMHASLQYLKAIGGASFSAISCDDRGNNIGFSFFNPAPVNYYWIGNGGDAGDVAHWSLTSGGPAAACLPLSSDNVVMDELSFDGTSVSSVNNIFGHNLDASSVDASVHLNYSILSGSLYLSPFCTFTNLTFRSDEQNNDVDLNGAKGDYLSTVIFNGTGSWSLLDSVYCRNLNFNGGRVSANGHKINAKFFTLDDGTGDFSDCLIETYGVSAPYVAGLSLFDRATILFKSGGGMNLAERVYQVIVEKGKWSAYGNVSKLSVNGIIAYGGEADSILVKQGTDFTIDGTMNVEDIRIIPHSDLCGTLTYFQAGSQGNGRIVKSSGTLELDHVSMFMVSAEGGAEFFAYQSVDLGSNEGWHFTSLPVTTFYWINDSGNWEDPQHWSLSSGGPAGNCIPGIQDKVVFDVNSFSGPGNLVVKDDDIVQVSGFTAQNIPENTGFTNSQFILFGDGVFSPHMKGGFAVVLKGGRPVHLTTNGLQFGLTSMADTAILMDDYNFLIPGGTISLARGFLDVSGKNIAAYNFSCYAITDSVSLDMTGTMLKSANASFSIRPWNIHTEGSQIRILCDDQGGTFRSNPEWAVGDFTFSTSLHFPYIQYVNVSQGLYPSIPVMVDLSYTGIDELYIGNLYVDGVALLMNASSIKQLLDYSPLYLDMYNQDQAKSLIENAQVGNTLVLRSGNIYFNYLKLMPGVSMTVNAGDTLFIHEFLDAVGSSSLPISMSSSVNGTSAYIHSNAADLCFAYLGLSNLTACGSATFYAGPSSTDIFNNSGWDFTSSCQSLTIEDNLPLCINGALVLTPVHPSNITGFLWTHPDGSQSNAEVLTKDPAHAQDLGLYELSAGGMIRKTLVYQEAKADTVIYVKNNAYIQFAMPVAIDTITWYYNDALSLSYEGSLIYPASNGDYYAVFTTASGCEYRTNTVSFNSANTEPLYKPYQLAAVVQEGGISLSWKDINSDRTGFEVYASNEQNSGYVKLATLNSYSLTYLDTRSLPAGTYYYKVRTVRNGNYSDYSDVAVVVVTVLSSQPSANKLEALSLYPVPMQDLLHIETGGELIEKLVLYNQQGVVLFEQEVNDSSAALVTAKLERGIYIVHIISENTTVYRTVVK